MFRLLLGLTVLTVGLVAAACGEADVPTATSTPTRTTLAGPTETPKAASPAVTSEVRSFALEDLTVQVGTAVTWVRRASVSHSTTSGSPGDADAGEIWDSGTLGADATFSHTLGQAGTFPYFCRFHPSTMRATVTVVENLAGQAASSPKAPAGDEPAAEPDAEFEYY